MNECAKNKLNHTISGSTRTKQNATVSNEPVHDEVIVKEIELKENSAYGTVHLAAVTTQQGEQEGVYEREETTHDYEDVSQL